MIKVLTYICTHARSCVYANYQEYVEQVQKSSLHNSGKGVMHDCASILDSIAKGITSIFRMVLPSPTFPFIQLNDFCTCKNIHTLASIQRSYQHVINARHSVVYSSLASCLFSSHKLSNREAVTQRRATSCLPLVYPHMMYHPRPSLFQRVSHPHTATQLMLTIKAA